MKRFTIVLFCSVSVLALALLASDANAYQRYNSGCQTCHGSFTGSTSPKGTVFPSGNKHEMHRSSNAMGTACNLCHRSDDGRNPYLSSSDGTATNSGLGCTGCHNAAGLRAHHASNGVSVCAGCHGAGSPPAENDKPAYYGTQDTRANNSCNSIAQANLNENWTIGDFLGLDNDGDDLYDASDPNCQTVPVAPTISTVSPLTSGTVGTAYSRTFAATGGTTPYSWSVTAGSSLPAGLTLSAAGVLSGTPTTAGTFNFSVTVSGGGTASKSFALTINAAAVTLSSISIAGSASVNEGGTATYTATASWSDGTSTSVTPTWSTNLGTISAAGLFTAPQVTSNQTATVGASYSSGGVTKTASKSVTVANVTATLSSISIAGSASVNEGGTATYTATAS